MAGFSVNGPGAELTYPFFRKGKEQGLSAEAQPWYLPRDIRISLEDCRTSWVISRGGAESDSPVPGDDSHSGEPPWPEFFHITKVDLDQCSGDGWKT